MFRQIYRIIIIITLFHNISFAQTYYGKNGLGKLQLINDSTYVVSFYQQSEAIFYDTGSYYKVKDTIFLSSQERAPFAIDTSENYVFEEGNCIDYIIKFYFKVKNKYKLGIESVGHAIHYDKKEKELQCYIDIYPDNILVIFNGLMYRRFKPIPYKMGIKDSYKSYKIKILDNKIDRVYLDKFPLIIKGKKLIPINKKQNEDCWINNGFYFPIMKESKNNMRNYERINLFYKGLIGLDSNMID